MPDEKLYIFISRIVTPGAPPPTIVVDYVSTDCPGNVRPASWKSLKNDEPDREIDQLPILIDEVSEAKRQEILQIILTAEERHLLGIIVAD